MNKTIKDNDWKLCYERLPDGLESYIRNVVLTDDKVIAYKGHQNTKGYCFKCHRRIEMPKPLRLRHLDYGRCPACGEKVTAVKQDAASGYLVDFVDEVIAPQLGKDGKTLFFRHFHIYRDYEDKYTSIKKFVAETERWALREGEVAKWSIELKDNWYGHSNRYRLDHWERSKKVIDIYEGFYDLFLPDNLEEIIKDTALKYCPVRDIAAISRHEHLVSMRMFIDWVRYPAIEKLWKAGYTELVKKRVNYELTRQNRGGVKWTAKDFKKIFPFPARYLEWKKPEEWKIEDCDKLRRLYKMKLERKLSDADVKELLESSISLSYIENALPYATIHKIIKYLSTQTNNVDWNLYGTYRDYLADCVTNGEDLSDKAVLFPKNLRTAHQRSIAKRKYIENKAIRSKFKKKVEAAEKKYGYACGKFFIRAPKNQRELIHEGAMNNSCVGGYAQDVANGKCTVLFIRKCSDPDAVFYTLELQGKQIIQCRTLENESYRKGTPVYNFVQRWMKEKVLAN